MAPLRPTYEPLWGEHDIRAAIDADRAQRVSAERGEYPPLPDELRTMRDLGRVAGPDTIERLMRAYVDADRAQRVPLTDEAAAAQARVVRWLTEAGFTAAGDALAREVARRFEAGERGGGIGAKP